MSATDVPQCVDWRDLSLDRVECGVYVIAAVRADEEPRVLYVGQTRRSIARRARNHLAKRRQHLSHVRTLTKHGCFAVKIVILPLAQSGYGSLSELEDDLIVGLVPAFNVMRPGVSSKGQNTLRSYLVSKFQEWALIPSLVSA